MEYTSEPTVATIMRLNPVTISQQATLAAAQSAMNTAGVHQLPVVDNTGLIGILAERDLHAHSGYYDRTKVDAAMTTNPLTVSPGDPARHAATVLIERGINALPVVEGGRLVGIVSRTDLLRLLIGLLDHPRA